MAEIDVHIVGIGNLGKSFLSGFGSISEGPKLYLYESNEDIVASFSDKQELKSSLGQLDEGVLLLCIKPNNLNEFITTNKELISPDVLIVTALAGLNITHFENIFKNKILRLMPNLSIKDNNGFIPYTKNYEDDYLGFIKCLNELGKTAEYPENLFDIITAIYGSGPAWYFELSSKIVDAAENSAWKKRKPTLLLNN